MFVVEVTVVLPSISITLSCLTTYIGSVVRQDKVIDIDGSTTLELGDRVIMCLLHSAIQKVEDFLSEDKELI